MFTHAITRQPGSDYPLGLTTASLPTPDFSLTLAQHEKYIACLRDIGLNVEELLLPQVFQTPVLWRTRQ